MTPTQWAIWWCLLVLAIAASALFSGIEVGCYSLNRVRLDLRAGRRSPVDHNARILRAELESPARLLGTLLIGNNIVNAIAADVTARMFQAGGYTSLTIAVLNTLLLGPLLFVVGDAAPKELFRVEADRLVPIFARALRLVRWILTAVGMIPLVRLCTHMLERALRLPRDAGLDARARVSNLLKEGAVGGVLSESQLTLLDRAMTFRSVRVRDEMIAWERVRVIPASADRTRIIELVGGGPHAFYPAVDRTGKVLGALSLLDLYAFGKKSAQELTRPVPRLAPDTPIRDALRALRQARSRIAIVEDASGKPVGLVTAKDLLEPLTGPLAAL